MSLLPNRAQAGCAAGALLASLLLPGLVRSQTLVADIDPTPPDSTAASLPAGFVELGGKVLFHATDPQHGRELWVSDGTPAGTVLLFDAWPGAFDSMTERSALRVVGNHVMFVARNDRVYGLFKTDGTAAGTTLVREFGLIWHDQPDFMFSDGTRLWFAAWEFPFGNELWVSDGTTAGTQMVTDLNPGHLDGIARSTGGPAMASLGGQLVFAADNGLVGPEIFITDGTAAGTRMLANVYRFPQAGSSPTGMATVGNHVVFAATDRSGQRLWYTTDGTPAGTIPLGNVGAPSLTAANRRGAFGSQQLLLEGIDSTGGSEPWITDGTPAGTRRLADIHPGTASSRPHGFVEWNGLGWFVASDATHGAELWRTDGTTAGTQIAVDVAAGAADGVLTDLATLGTGLVFGGDSADGSGTEPHFSNGTAASTVRLADLMPGPSGSMANANLTGAIGQVFFGGETALFGTEPQATDGTAGGTVLLGDLARETFGSNPRGALSSGPRAWFLAEDPQVGVEPFFTDGTPAGTQLWADLSPGSGLSSLPDFTADGDIGWWSTSGLLLTADLYGNNPQLASNDRPNAFELVKFDGRMFYTDLNTRSLLSGDGSPDGVREVFRLGFGTYIVPPAHLTVAGGELFFVTGFANSPGSGLFVTDGTAAGTRLHLPLTLSVSGRNSVAVERLGDGVLVLSAPFNNTHRLWWTDGSNATQLATFGNVPQPAHLTPVGVDSAGEPTGYVFRAATAGQDFEPWVTDGTAAGTVQLADVLPGTFSSEPRDFTRVRDGRVFFSADDGTHGRELWVTDGTVAGTQMVRDAVPGSRGLEPAHLLALGDAPAVAFQGSDFAGAELWSSDGTAAGTLRRADLWAGGASSGAAPLIVQNGYLLLRGDDGTTGDELWRMPLADVGGYLTRRFGGGCPNAAGERPRIGSVGAPTLGTTNFEVHVRDGHPSSPSGLLLDFALNPLRVPSGCTIWLPGAAIALGVTTDSNGSARITLPVPNDPNLLGLELYGQWLVDDPNGTLGGVWTMSDVLQTVIGG